jgi:hypothetical protein
VRWRHHRDFPFDEDAVSVIVLVSLSLLLTLLLGLLSQGHPAARATGTP